MTIDLATKRGGLQLVSAIVVGAIKSDFAQQTWHWSGLETLTLSGAAVALDHVVGMALGGLAHQEGQLSDCETYCPRSVARNRWKTTFPQGDR